ncbi:N-acetylmuramoyl-L-alanine amidase family protein [Orenia marismortui]|uniref:N-acetylmuramoyl-L-alanine amidase n=1 Tax=Orenia marismortui TaxID=46469 RepID=A0A4R8H9C0_9FIRM|nr:N-acetylmuramoyl-L-alanine amidase [Orenia marismortui]TDX51644.1 N-acetylmuramoyl-L-alanine amidase [Orenia marismortui]
MIIRAKKYMIYILILIFYIIFFLPNRLEIDVLIPSQPIAQQRVVVIDPGHGGVDGGTSYGGILEKDINLEIGLELRRYLEKNSNVKVIMTRQEDIALDHLNKYSSSRHTRDLRARIDRINQLEADIFISLHVDNRINQPWQKGAVVLYYPRHQQNKIIAEIVQRHLNNLKYPGVKIKDHKILKRRNLYILKAKKTPGILIELGFITNYEDRKLLVQKSYQRALVKAIYRGIEEYFSGFRFLDLD